MPDSSTTPSAEFTRSAFTWRDGKLTFAKCSTPLDIRWSRELPSAPSTVTVTKDAADRYFVSMLCEFEPTPLPIVPTMIGIDLGLTHLAILSSGEKIENPAHTKTHEKKLAKPCSASSRVARRARRTGRSGRGKSRASTGASPMHGSTARTSSPDA